MMVRSVLAAALLALLGACAQLQPLRGDRNEVEEPSLTERGFYRLPTDERWCGEFCDLGRHYVDVAATDFRGAELEVRAGPDPAAPVIDQLAMGEWVRATRSELHSTRRGVVRRAGDGYELGDIVFFIESANSDWEYWLWRRGELRSFPYDRCEEDCPEEPPAEGLWIVSYGDSEEHWMYVEREDGRPSGWLLNPHFPSIERAIRSCEALDLSPICRSVRSRAEPVTATFPAPRPFRDCDADCPSMVWLPGQSFAVSQYEVTSAQWHACVVAGGCAGDASSPPDANDARRPVTYRTWRDAQAYVQWLSRVTGQRYRLLTAAEWGLSAFPGGRLQQYHWGNDAPVCEPGARNGVAFAGCGPVPAPLTVGSFQPNAFGLYDMLGNATEWAEESAILGGDIGVDADSLGGRIEGHPEHEVAGIRVARDR